MRVIGAGNMDLMSSTPATNPVLAVGAGTVVDMGDGGDGRKEGRKGKQGARRIR